MPSRTLHDDRPIETTENRYDDAVEDFWRDMSRSPQNKAIPFDTTTTAAQAKDIDEEIKITKKRRPIAKLDADKLTSERGIPELRRRARRRLKFQGKGHEYTDMARVLGMYQMWLDDLYPRAKFKDGLTLIERVGHTKRLQVMRKQWIQDTRPTATIGEMDDAAPASGEAARIEGDVTRLEDQPEPDELDAMMSNEHSLEADDHLDDLDALMAWDGGAAPVVRASIEDNRFDDDEEAMAGMW